MNRWNESTPRIDPRVTKRAEGRVLSPRSPRAGNIAGKPVATSGARYRWTRILVRIGRFSAVLVCSREVARRGIREEAPPLEIRWNGRRTGFSRRKNPPGVGEVARHWRKVVAGSASETSREDETRSGSNPGHGGAAGPRVGEARCGGVGMDRPQYPRRRDRGYLVYPIVLTGDKSAN